MSLKTFHIVFVTLSSLLCFGFGGWSLRQYQSEGGATSLVLGIAALLAGAGLVVYGRWFWRKITTREEEDRKRRQSIHKVPVVLAGMVLAERAAWGCSVCYGEAEGPLIDGARLGVYMLFGLVLLMQIAFAGFFVYLWRRARRLGHGAAGPFGTID